MSVRDPKLWLALLSLAAVLVIVALDSERTTPGPLTTTHARVGELAGNAGCERCHGARGQSMEQACSQCHAEIGAQLAGGVGFHGGLDDGSKCARCHREHLGDELALAGDHAFDLAGVEGRAGFEHVHVAFALHGVHAALECSGCHANADVEHLDAGQKRFLGLTQACTACHDDPHEGRFVRGCEACHGQERPFAELGSFAHTPEFPLTGAHASASCADCHAPGSERSVEALGGVGPHPEPRTCVDCHASPHSLAFEFGAAQELGVAQRESCARCHASTATTFARADASLPRELHRASGFALDAPHERATCEQCHGARASFGEARSPDDCAACHANPHGEQFSRAGTSTRCLDCHERAHFGPPAFDLAAHAATSFPLDGAHAQAACNDCHEQRDDEPRVFRGTPDQCGQCHVDAHGSALVNVERSSAFPGEASGGTCALCHSTGSFADATFTPEQHADATAFGLFGAHARASCEACHPRSARPDASGRTFGRVAEHTAGDPNTCATCHSDVHQGAFDRGGLPASVAGRTSCARCHSQERFGELPLPFDHGAWTSFALEGAHADASCAACHGSATGDSARKLGRVRDHFAGSTQRCATCHVDAHGGAFERIDPGVDCSQCHSTVAFETLDGARFDHERWTGFELAGAHARAACAACHVPARTADVRGREFGRAAGKSCADCHVDPHAGQFARAGSTDCARCHSSSGAFELVGFDHARDTRLRLDAQHARLACNACHVPWPTASGAKVVRYKPLGTQCADCHGFERRGGQR